MLVAVVAGTLQCVVNLTSLEDKAEEQSGLKRHVTNYAINAVNYKPE